MVEAKVWVSGISPENLVERYDFNGDEMNLTAEVFDPGYYEEPYVGAGIGAFWARISDSTGSDNDVSPGVNALGGLRFYFNEDVALFTEYKYNYTKFTDSLFKATYPSHGIYGGLSFHF